MNQITQTAAIKAFLTASTHADLADLYTKDMECQVNVAQDGGQRVEGEFQGRQWHAWTDGVQTWKSFRIPVNASSEPTYEEKVMRYDLATHAEGIGMTGWDWKNRLSRWVAFDFDAIAGHKDDHTRKMTDEDLIAVREAACQIPWVTVRKSTGGKGLHLYVFLTPTTTQNHNEHAALARSILGKMSALTGYDFSGKVDVCGSNMWVWHRKMALAKDGLSLIKQGGRLTDIPFDWKSHVKVITGHRRRNLPKFIEQSDGASDIEKMFEELTGMTVEVPLDDEHKRLIKWLEENKTQSWWDSDHHMLVTHTYHLKQAFEELNLKGIYDTKAKGTEAGHDHNLFAYPLRRGGWVLRRYSMGVEEAPSWSQDGRGWTRCFYNVEPDLGTAARAFGGLEHPSGGFVFKEADSAIDAAKALGAPIPELPAALRAKKTRLKPHKDGRLVIEVDGDPEAVVGDKMKSWLHEKGVWKKVLNAAATTALESEVGNYDDLIRHIVTESGEDCGWVLKGDGNAWRTEPLKHVQAALESMNIPFREVKTILGSSVLKCWKLVNRPFQVEYPGNRLWNRNAAQLRFIPTQKEKREYPTWQKILRHLGKDLDGPIQNNPWAQANGILTGADYLKIWLSSLFKEPNQPLPYLFFWGDQDCGKSMFHEAISLLMTSGYQRADAALINPQGFNGELANAILCVIEEISLRKSKDASNRIKDWVTARQLPVHIKGKTPYHVPNTTHWVQCSNMVDACPIFPGDTRIVMIHVENLDMTEKIPKKMIIPMLEREAPDFLAELLALEIPPSNDRLNVPVITTIDKIEAEQSNRTHLQAFIEEKCHAIQGCHVLFSEFYDRFIETCPTEEISHWTKIRVGRELPTKFPKGRLRQSAQMAIGNISLKPYDGPVLPKLKQTTDAKNQIWLDPEGK